MIKSKIPMNMELLNLICLVQSYYEYKLDEVRLLGDTKKDDPKKMTEEYFNNLPDELLNKYGLGKNYTSFNKVLNYQMTDEILNTVSDELHKFHF